MSQDNKRNFILHGSILAMACIFVRIIGMVYRIPMVNIIGSEGTGIYSVAYNVYNIMLVLSSYGLPMAVSKLVSERFAAKKFKSASKIFTCSLTIAVITGGIAALLMFFGADFIENVLTREEFIGYLRGNIIKYQSRANLKGRKEEDLKKAKWYSDKLVEVLKNE